MAAEASLASAQRQPQCLVSVLGLLTQEQVPLQVRQAAAVFFKNVVRRHWEPEVTRTRTLTLTPTLTPQPQPEPEP